MAGHPSRRGFLGGALGLLGASGLTSRPARAEQPVRIDGERQTVSVDPDEVLLDTLRAQGHTAPKPGCRHGACGACTVWVDGEPVASCLLPTASLAPDAEVRTLADLTPTDGLHPVQRAFLDEDALQCGYCTPGFVTSAIHFYEQWRAEHRGRPSHAEVADALEGHLCRCGAHPRILTAVARACAGELDDGVFTVHRVDGPDKVTGRARYTVDQQLDGLRDAVLVRADVPHATLTGLDLDAARAVPGVSAVVGYLQVGHTVRYVGQLLAALVADSGEAARQAVAALAPTYAEKPAVVGIAQALAPGAPVLYASRREAKEAPSAAEGATLGAPLDGNLRGPVRIPFAKPNAARRRLEDAAQRHQETYVLPTQCHTAMEPHAAVAHWPDGTLEVWASTQSVHPLALDLADHYELRFEQVRVHAEFVGGGFGAKAGLHLEAKVAADLSRIAGHPVRVAYARDEELGLGGLRPGAEVQIDLASDADGNLLALGAIAHNDGGASVGSASANLMRLMYPSPFKDLQDFDVVSNTPPCHPFRGPGGPAALFPLEQAVDAIATERGESPLALRQRWDQSPHRQRLYDWVASLPAWQERGEVGADTGRYRRGLGLASSCWIPFVQLGVEVELRSGPDGLVAASACQDMGNGSKTSVAIAIAEVFGLPHTDITVRFGDSHDPVGPLSGGSRTTVSIAPAAADAAVQLVEVLARSAEDQLGLTEVVVESGGLRHSAGLLPWREALQRLPPARVVGRRKRDPGGYFLPFRVGGLGIYKAVPAGVTLVEVEVDTRLGITRATRAWAGLAIGRVWSPRLATTQVEGAVIQGISYALYEDRRVDPRDGGLLTAGLETYRIAGLGDAPEIEVHFDDTPWEGVTGGGIGLSELATVGVAAAVGNALHHAVGVRFPRMPFTPAELLGRLT